MTPTGISPTAVRTDDRRSEDGGATTVDHQFTGTSDRSNGVGGSAHQPEVGVHSLRRSATLPCFIVEAVPHHRKCQHPDP
jgi:hypothetical protein